MFPSEHFNFFLGTVMLSMEENSSSIQQAYCVYSNLDLWLGLEVRTFFFAVLAF
jgi:hypothetical protein